MLMKMLVRLLAFVASLVAAVASNDGSYSVKKHIFNAVVDHYNFRPHPTFPLRYYVSDDYWKNTTDDGVVFFYAGNEADILQFVNNSGFMFEAAPEFNALVVFCEHRYYGTSLIDWDDTYQYLTVEQAMEDFNTLTVHLRQTYDMSPKTPFIAFGGSYGGNLAMWLRLKNPNLWAGAIASSATPLKHVLRETNNFNRIETDVYANVSQQCPTLIRRGWKELYDNVTTDDAGRRYVASVLGLCTIPSDASMANSIYGFVSGALETMVQYGYPYPTDFYNPVPGYPFQVACHGMLEAATGLGALRAAMDVYYNFTGQAGSCYGQVAQEGQAYWHRLGAQHRLVPHEKRLEKQDSISSSKQTRKAQEVDDDYEDDGVDHRMRDSWEDPWGYQTCTEAYQPMPTDGVTDFELPHTPNETAYFENCQKRFGVVPRPNWEEMHFMGADISTGSNIFLASGQLDPWRAAGIQEAPKGSPESIIVRIIENGAHHFDLRASHPLDPPSVIKVREEERAAMREWIVDWKARH